MNLQKLLEQTMQQAAEKGFGVEPEELVVSEKIALLHSELSEAYQGYKKNNLEGKDGLYEEIGDTLQRALHLCGVYKVELANLPNIEIDTTTIESGFVTLHNTISVAWENYRHKKIDEFKKQLLSLLQQLIIFSEKNNIPLEKSIQKKFKHNEDRQWDKNSINEKLV